MSYLLRCPDCLTPTGLKEDAAAKCPKCAAQITSVGAPTHANPPRVMGVKGSWWASWDGSAPPAALAAMADYETKNAATIAKLQTARAETIARQQALAYSAGQPTASDFVVPPTPTPGPAPDAEPEPA